jgi:hypothetical protein
LIIIVLFVFLAFYRICKIVNKEDQKHVIYALSLNIVLCIIFLFFLQNELFAYRSFDGTVGSDAYEYYRVALYDSFNYRGDIISYSLKILGRTHYLESRGYQILNYLIFISSPYKTSIILKIFNIVILQNIIVLTYFYVKNTLNFNCLQVKIMLYIMAINGGFIFTATRVLKDTFYLFLLLEFLVILNFLIKKPNFKGLILIFSVSILSNYFRPYNFIINFVVFLTMLYIWRFKNCKIQLSKVSILFVACFILILLIAPLVEPINDVIELRFDSSKAFYRGDDSHVLRESFFDTIGDNIFIRTAFGVLRFILLPSPFRTLLSPVNADVYWFEGYSGKILIFQWSIMFYLGLLSLIALIYRHHQRLYEIYPLLLINIMLITTYAVLYAGAAQTRWKLPFIFLANVALISFFSISSTREKYLLIVVWIILLLLEVIWAVQWL